jgi:hypothetical protein
MPLLGVFLPTWVTIVVFRGGPTMKKIKEMLQTTWGFILRHKIIAILVLVAAVIVVSIIVRSPG